MLCVVTYRLYIYDKDRRGLTRVLLHTGCTCTTRTGACPWNPLTPKLHTSCTSTSTPAWTDSVRSRFNRFVWRHVQLAVSPFSFLSRLPHAYTTRIPCTHIHTYIYTQDITRHPPPPSQTHTYMYAHTAHHRPPPYRQTHTHAHTHSVTHSHLHTHTHTHTHTHSNTHTHTHTHTPRTSSATYYFLRRNSQALLNHGAQALLKPTTRTLWLWFFFSLQENHPSAVRSSSTPQQARTASWSASLTPYPSRTGWCG